MIETQVEPPLPDCDDDDGSPALSVAIMIREADETGRSAFAAMSPDADNATIADELVRAAIAAAGLRTPELADAVRRRMSDEGKP